MRAGASKWLSTGAINLINRIRKSEDGELTYNRGGGWWVDTHRVSARYVLELERMCLLRQIVGDFGAEYQVKTLSSDCCDTIDKGKKPMILAARRARRKG